MGPGGDGPGHGGPADQFWHGPGGPGGPGGFGHPPGWPGGFDGPGPWLILPATVIAFLAVVVLLTLLWRTGRAAGLLAGPRPRALPDRTWDVAVERHRALAAEYAAYECDPRSILDLPALADVRQPATARFVDAFAEASALLTDRRPPEPYARQFVEAVERAQQAWVAAREAARRRGGAAFGSPERALIDQLRTLLDVVDSSAFEAERRAAFAQARNRFAELERRTGWRLPEPAALAVEAGARPALAAAAEG
jgi:hypothetical protein